MNFSGCPVSKTLNRRSLDKIENTFILFIILITCNRMQCHLFIKKEKISLIYNLSRGKKRGSPGSQKQMWVNPLDMTLLVLRSDLKKRAMFSLVSAV